MLALYIVAIATPHVRYSPLVTVATAILHAKLASELAALVPRADA